MGLIDNLKSIGLSKWESEAYLSLLELGASKTGAISKRSGVPQSKIYIVLESLISKGLVSYIIKGKTKHFIASDPGRVMTLFKEKENELALALSRVSTRAPEPNSVEIFEGWPAIRLAKADMIQDAKKGEQFYGYSPGETSTVPKLLQFYDWWGERKRLAGLKDHLLITFSNKKEFEATIPKEDLSYVRWKTRYCSIWFPGDVGIFRDTVCINNFVDVKAPTCIVIKSRTVALEHKKFFLSLWEKATK